MTHAPTPNPGPANAPVFLSVPAAAKILGVSRMTLYRLISEDDFPAVRIRGRIVIPAQAIQEMTDAALTTRKVVEPSDVPPARAAGM